VYSSKLTPWKILKSPVGPFKLLSGDDDDGDGDDDDDDGDDDDVDVDGVDGDDDDDDNDDDDGVDDGDDGAGEGVGPRSHRIPNHVRSSRMDVRW
jgi:hypothetical protein